MPRSHGGVIRKRALADAVTFSGSVWGLVTGRGVGLGLTGSTVAEGQWCFLEVCGSIRKGQAQLLPLVVVLCTSGDRWVSPSLLGPFLAPRTIPECRVLKTLSVSDKPKMRNSLLKMLMPYKAQ